MDNLLDNFGHRNNFWKYNPQFLAVKEFDDFYKKDKSKSKELSSRIMWAIAFFVHPASVFKNLDEADKQHLIAKDYILDEKFNWDSVSGLVDTFSLLVLTKSRKSLDAWERKLRERDYFIESTAYSLDTFEDLDKAMKATHDMWKQYRAIRDQVLAEGDTVIDKGGSKPSLSDEGKI